MLAAGWGRIVTISSSSAQSGAPNMAHYVASKGGRHRADQGVRPRAGRITASRPTRSRRPSSTRPWRARERRRGTCPSVEIMARMIPLGRAGTPGRHRGRLRVPLLGQRAATSPGRSSASTAACTSEGLAVSTTARPAGSAPRRRRPRGALLDAAEQLMLEEGYAAVTSRRVAAQAGLKPQLVHYYFRTMDDLFLAVFRRRAEPGARAPGPGARVAPAALGAVGPEPRPAWHRTDDGVHGAGQPPQGDPGRDRRVGRAVPRSSCSTAFASVLGRYGVDERELPAAGLRRAA